MPQTEPMVDVQAVNDLVAGLDPIQHLRNLDFPRRAGTEGDRRAAAYIAQALRNNGIEPVLQEFHFSKPKVLPRLALPLALLLWVLLSLANVRFWESNLIVSLFVLALPLALILFVLNLGCVMPYLLSRRRRKLRRVEARLEDGSLSVDQVVASQNVIAEIGPKDAENQVLLTAHHDSISSKLPMRVSIVCAMAGTVGFLLYSVFYLIHVITGSFPDLAFPLVVILALISLVGLEVYFVARLFKGNASHGTIDDGTGVAILLELAKLLKDHEIAGTRFTFGFFGAEESGLVGSAHYYMHRTIDKTKLHVISIDMIGEKPPLAYVKGIFLVGKRRMDAAFNQQLVSIAKALGIEVKGKSFPYPGSDFGHFMLGGGCRTNWLINGSRMIHSRRDNLSNVNQALVNDALNLLVAYLLREGGTKG